jgi:hypothetical protein
MSTCSYCIFMYLHRASWQSSATLTEVFRAFSSVVRQMRGYNPQRRDTVRTLPKFLYCSIYCLFCVDLCIVCKRVLYYCQRVSTQLQLKNVSHHVISFHIISHYHIISKHVISCNVIYHIYLFSVTDCLRTNTRKTCHY